MASYDSESDDETFTETNVLLGYASKEATDDTTSQLGGHPVCFTKMLYTSRIYTKTLL